MNDNQLTGVFPDMANDTYHAHPALGSTGLKLLAQSPLHYWAAYLDPNRDPREETTALRIGRACHTAMLEPEKIGQHLIVLPEDLNRRTNEGKKLWAEIVGSGREPISAAEWNHVSRIAAAAHRHPVTRILFERGQAKTEVSLFWTDPETGAPCKIRPDIMVEPCQFFPDGLIADLKTTDDARPEAFGRSAWNWDMHLQAALYPEGFMAVFGTRKPPAFLWLAQEKSPPYANQYHSCPANLAAYGRQEVRRLRQLYADCRRTGLWPGYSQVVQPLPLPAWAAKIVSDEVAA